MGDVPVKEILTLKGITKSYPRSNSEYGHTVFQPLDLSLHEGEFLCVLGPSGCGKTTLLKIAASLIIPDSGKVFFEGKEVTKPEKKRLMLLQDDNQLFPWLTVLGNVGFPLKHLGHGVWRQVARSFLKRVHLEDFENYYPYQLSGGMKQRVAIARALCGGSRILLMDEPFRSLDVQTRKSLHDFLLEISCKNRLSILFVSHDIRESLYLGDRLAFMDQDGVFISIKKNPLSFPRDPASKAFFEVYKDFVDIIPAPRQEIS